MIAIALRLLRFCGCYGVAVAVMLWLLWCYGCYCVLVGMVKRFLLCHGCYGVKVAMQNGLDTSFQKQTHPKEYYGDMLGR